MKKNINEDDIIYSVILLVTSYFCTLSLKVPLLLIVNQFIPIPYPDSMFGIYYIISAVIEFIVFSIAGFKLKFNYKSLMIFFVVLMLFSVLVAHLRGGMFCELLLNFFITSYKSFFESLIAPACETIAKTLVLLISSLIAKKWRKRKKGD